MTKCMIALGLSIVIGATARADDPVKLVYRYSPGQVLQYDGTQKMTVESTVSGTTQRFTSETSSLREWRVLGVDANGNARLAMSILRVKVLATDSAGRTTQFDTDSTDQKGPLAELVGKPVVEVSLSPSGQVLELGEAKGTEAGPFVASVRTLLFPVPPTPIVVGSGWQTELELPAPPPLGPSEKLKLRQTYRLEKVTDSVAHINLVTATAEEIKDRARLASIVQFLPSGRIELDLSRGIVRSTELKIDQTVKDFAGSGSVMQVSGTIREALKDDVAGTSVNRR